MPDEILHCPEGSAAAEGGAAKQSKKKSGKMKLGEDGFLPEPPLDLRAKSKGSLRNMFSHCQATRMTNQAARDYRKWFCSVEH